MMVSRRPGGRMRPLWLVLAGLATLGLLGACSATTETGTSGDSGSDPQTPVTEPEGDPVDGGNLAVGVIFDATGWNPTVNQWDTSAAFAGSSMLEPLTTLDASANAQPWLATSWTANDDFTQWTLTLRDDVTFHDGTPFDADVVAGNFDDATSSPLTGVALGGIFGEVKAIDATHVEVNLNEPWAAFPTAFLAGPNAFMRSQSMLDDPAGGSANPVGTGPFKFASWESGGALKVVRNDSYWREGEPHLDQIEFTAVADDISRTNAILSGDLDVMLTSSANDANDLDGEYQVIRDWGTETTLLIVNTRETAGGNPNPLSNQHARLALSYATDPQAIADLVGENLEVPTSPFSKDSPWADPSIADNYASYDPDKAKSEVEAYKQDTGEDTLRVVLTGTSETSAAVQLQAIAQQWSEVGIETQIDGIDQSALGLQGVTGKFQVMLGPIYSAPDPDQNYIFWSETTVKPDGEIGINFSGYATDETQAALEEGRNSASFEDRKAGYADLLKLLNEQATNIYVYYTPWTIVASDQVHGLQHAQQIPFGNFQPNTLWGEVWFQP